ncbi:cupin domain-containing protein [Desulfohalobiaceae bacterium Ax17]|uniref:cupin domain-containing protein n=1 Tax=Desulfovulcanus ferrireducens TaxID=2831190 RepID=UPI00207BA8DB|nr:cupin domain-containing protein [Desulfovulcanus ferrireducens]MBT8763133.1 cupin domain-containing protein [Desulfovulcanus ferrireducens]
MAKFLKKEDITFEDHPKFEGVKIAKLVSSQDTDTVSVSMLEISPDTEIPIHTHDPNIDSVYVLEGQGEVFTAGKWQKLSAGDYIFIPAQEEHGVKNTGKDILKLFVVHSPPFF